MTAFIMKRSIWASGRLNVPSSSIGFSVAITMNGLGKALPADGRGTLGHGLKHGGLGFGIRTVDLVQQYEIGVNRTDLRGELLRRKIEDLRAHQIRWHEIRSALHALERAGYAGGERLGGRGLGQARHGFDKNMPAGHQGHDKRFA